MRKYWLVLLSCIVPFTAFASPTLSFLSEENPPVNYSDTNKQPAGLSVELLNLIWNEMNEPRQAIHFMPWARAYFLTQKERNTVLFATSRIPDREKLFKWVCPISYSDVVLIGHRKNLSHDSKPLQELSIGVVRADIAEDVVIKQSATPLNLVRTQSIEQLLLLLERNKVDVIATYSTVAYTSMQYLGMEPILYPITRKLYELQDCYAFNKDVDEHIVARYQQALNQVRNKPSYKALLERYHMVMQKK